MKSLCVAFTLISLLSLGACSSKKPKVQKEAPATSMDGDVILNGSSDDGNAGHLKTVHFLYNESTLDQRAKNVLKANAEYLKSHPTVSVQIEGHCDERGSRQFNLALGERRAKIVRDYLTALGIKSKRLAVMSWGNEKPLSDGSDEGSWSKNRRGNFVVTAK